jgi:hypothetical protein
MTEREWLAQTDSCVMLKWMYQRRNIDRYGANRGDGEYGLTARQLRLFACACCRYVWHLLGAGREVVEAAERHADDPRNFMGFYGLVGVGDITQGCCGLSIPQQQDRIRDMLNELHRRVVPMGPLAALLRDIVGNSPNNAPLLSVCGGDGQPVYKEGKPICHDCRAILDWREGSVPKMAKVIYEERDFDHMPILADALEDAGCHVQAVLDHCRGPGPHARGCWVLEMTTGLRS